MKYAWWDRWLSLRTRVLPQAKAEQAIAIAADFIEENGLEAERDGWRPIHIMKPMTGLAWRWPFVVDPVFRPRLMAVRIGRFDFIYRAERDGSTTVLKGKERTRALVLFGLAGEYSQ